MAITNNNVQNVQFLRNREPFASREAALAQIESAKSNAIDGTSLLARYSGGTGEDFFINTIVGYVAVNGNDKYLTIIDVEGSSADVEELRQEINAKLGNGVGSGASETVTAQLTALSGNSSTDTSATTSVEGAKKYAYDLLGTLDYTDTAVAGSYVSEVTQSDGKIISTTKVELPSLTDTASAKTFVTSVSEDKGQIAVTKGTITSANKTITLTDNADGGVDFAANVDGTTIIIDENTGTMSVASSALVQYEGDDDTVQISAVQDGVRTVSSPLTIQKVTTGLSEIVKEEYRLIGASGNTIGAPVQIYKDSHIVSITYITEGEHAQNLEYVYIDASGNTQTTYVDMSELVLETEFASGVTVTDGIAHGVVDPTSETFLTVGANGFKLSGVQDAIDAAFEALDADESGSTEHVSVRVEEADGKITAVTVAEDNIANADDLAELSGKTITAITSNNSSITATIDDAVGNKSYNIETDASKIKMSGFTSTDVLSGITSSSSITEAFQEVDNVITENERVTSQALNDLDGRLDVIESGYVETVKVNNVALTETSNAVNIEVESATSAMTATSTEAIVVDTDANGGITLGLAGIDCGYYD